MMNKAFLVSEKRVATGTVDSEGFSVLLVGEALAVSEDGVASGTVVAEEISSEVRHI